MAFLRLSTHFFCATADLNSGSCERRRAELHERVGRYRQSFPFLMDQELSMSVRRSRCRTRGRCRN